MLEETSTLIGLEVFTPWGVKVGNIANIEVDSEDGEISNLYLEETNDALVQNGEPILLPFRWVQALGDIVILKHFPKDVPIHSEGVPENEYRF